MKEKHEKRLYWAILFSETSHVFCCVLPTLFSIASILAGLGVMATVPGWLDGFHSAMHGYEVPMITLSAAVVALGWGLHFYSKRIDCHDTGCHHEPCGTKKKNTSKVLVVATVLLVVNVSVYFGFHRSVDNQVVHDVLDAQHSHMH